MNIAILGSGNIANKVLAPALNQVDGVRLWSVLSRDLKRGSEFARMHGAQADQPAYTDLKKLLIDPDLDAVIIATPDRLHAKQAIECAEAGKHILVEKPMCTDTKSGEAMVQACRTARVHLAVGYHLRWHAGHRMLVEGIRAGKLGDLRHMRAHWTWKEKDNSNWRASAEVGRWWSLAGVGTHCLDMIRWVMVPVCGEIMSIKSLITKAFWGGPHDETAIVSMQFESGATAEFCSSVLFESPYRIEIHGNIGSAICDDTFGRQGSGKIFLKNEQMRFTPCNPYVGEIRDFVASIIENRPPEVDGAEGLRNVELLEALGEDS